MGITSPGGYGKSTLTAKVYRDASNFDRKFWISFEQPYRFSLFGRWLLEQFGEEIDEKTDNDALVNQLIHYLSQERCLLVMDNVESLLQDRQWQEEAYQSFLLKWLGRENASVLILTSREHPFALEQRRVESEWRRLQGLNEDDGIKLLHDQGIEGAEIDLKQFVKIADGHPLLLKLAASWLKDQPVHTPDVTHILTQKDLNLFEQLVGAHRDVETSVGGLLTESLNRLQPHFKDLWLNLSVYRLPFVLAAAQVMSSKPITKEDLRGLVKRSLLEEQPSQGEWQFKFLPLLKTFAQQQLGNQADAHRQAIVYYRSLRNRENLNTLKAVSAYIEIIHHNCQLKQYRQTLELLQLCSEFSELPGYTQRLLELYEQLIEELKISANERGLLRIALNDLGNIHSALEEYEKAIDCYQESLEIMKESNDLKGKAYVLGNLGTAHHSIGQVRYAKDLYLKSLEVARSIHDLQGEANALGNLGSVERELGDFQIAIAHHEQALTIYGKIGDLKGKASCFLNLGNTYAFLGQYDLAAEFCHKSRNICCNIGDLHGEASSAFNLGNALRASDQFSEAKNAYLDAHNLFQAMGLEAKVQDCDIAIQSLSD